MRVNYNISSIIARNALNNNDMRLSASTQRLSSGYKINSAKDDAAGLAISRKMNAQIKSLQQANRNANDGLSVVNTADGAMSEMHDILQRMNELSIQAANGTNADSDREQIQLEIDQLVQELDRIADTTQFNAQNLLDGSFAYKGYTNAENIKVMSYGDGVQSGIYAIDHLTYYHYEDSTTYYDISTKEVVNANGTTSTSINKSVTKVITNDRYQAKSADEIQNALMGTASISAFKTEAAYQDKYEEIITNGSGEMKAFEEGVRVTLEDENIILKGNNDFEVKLTLNDNTTKNVESDIVTTTTTPSTITTDCYRNIAVTTQGGNNRYNIRELNFAVERDENGNIVPKKADDQIDGEGTDTYTSSKEVGLRDLEEDFADLFKEQYPNDTKVSVTEFKIIDTVKPEKFEMKLSVTDKTGTSRVETMTLDLYQEKDTNGTIKEEKTLENYLYSTTQTTKTKYEVGVEGNMAQSITLDLTGMGPMRFQVGANEGQIIEVEIPALNAVNLGVDGLDISTEDAATAAIDIVGKAINQLSAVRAKIGAYANRIEHTITNLDTTEENMTASYSRIMDVDMATEMTEYSTMQVLVQASTAMLSQANERPQQVLQLIQ
ncbi:MAG: hypothetical protein II247_03620 [Lachnospiraceae bacterium]|nr:hypothetical protein [Lachnospiraceae bacterium]